MTASRLFFAIGLAVTVLGPRHAAAQQATPPNDGAYRGHLAVRLTRDGEPTVIAAHNADRLFVPASVLKVVTVAAALEHLGADYRWRTRLTAATPVAGGVLDGDVVIEPGADPTWGASFFDGGAAEPLAALADQLRARGVTRITGDLIIDVHRFPGRPHPVGRAFGDLPYRLGTPAAPLAVDEATVVVRVAAGPGLGAPARVDAPAGVEVINLTTTVGRDRHGVGTLDFVPVWGTDMLLLRGEYPISEAPFVVDASDPAPELRVARRLRETLVAASVSVDGAVRLGLPARSGTARATTLAELRSRPLAELLEPVLTESHNWYADMLALTLGYEVGGSGRFDDGVEAIRDFVTGLPSQAGGAGLSSSVRLRDGSGLSSANLVTPAAIVRVLAYARVQPWGALLIEALAGTGEGTLAAWPPLPPIAAKTGSMSHTVALAGFLGADSEAPVIFCYVINHHPARPSAARREIASALERWNAVGGTR